MSDPLTGLNPDALLRAAQSPGEVRWGWESPPVADLAPQFPGYRIERLLGRGGMGAVYLAWQLELNRPVALKLLPPELGANPDAAERFRREARTLARVKHPNVVEVFDSGTTGAGHLWFTMEFVEGVELGKWESGKVSRGEKANPSPALPPLTAFPPSIEILRQITDALEAVHAAGIIHRDLKPSNILLTRDSTVKVVDFGVAGLFENAQVHRLSRLTMTGTALGTAGYAAPEQVNGKDADARADIFALGVIAYELLTGTLPQGVFEPPSVKAGVDAAFDAVVLTAMQSDPAKRYRTAADFRTALLRAADVRVQAETHERELRAKLLRRTRLAGVFAALALIVAGLAGFALRQRQEARRQTSVAQGNRADAEKLVNYLMVGFRNKLNDIGRQDLVEDFQTQLGDYIAKVPRAEDEAGTESRRQFFAERTLAAAQSGRFTEAITNGLRGIEQSRALVALQPTNEVRQCQLVESQTTVGLVYGRWLRSETNQVRRTELLQKALAHFNSALRDAVPLTNSHASPQALALAAGTWRRTATVLKAAGRTNECEPYWNTARVLLDRALAANPSAAEAASVKDALAMLHGDLSTAALARRDLTNALEHAFRYESLSRELLPTNGLNVMVHGQAAEGLQRIGEVLTELGRQPEAVERFEAARALWDRLVPIAGAKNPYPVRYRGLTLTTLATTRERLGETNAANELRALATADRERAEAILRGEN